MARIAIIEAHPYEAAWGGEAVYLDRIRAFLAGQGHAIDSYVTDVVRGRTNPLLKLKSSAKGAHRWIIRNALPLRAHHFLACDPKLACRSLGRLFGRRIRPEHGISEAETAWICERLRATPPDLALLAFGASRFAASLSALSIPTVALRGFFSDRRIHLGGGGQISEPSPDPRLLSELSQATLVSFNNRLDLDLYERLSGSRNTALIGFGFPRRNAAPPAQEPIVLFVGACTRPNIEGLRWFLEKAWPGILATVPSARLRVVGAVGADFEESAFKNIEIVGFVDDLRQEYGRSQLVIAPLLTGTSGVKTKVAEALSFGRPVVTTSLGMDLANPQDLRDAVDVADDPPAFAEAVNRILTSRSHRESRHQGARAQFERRFSEDAAYAPLLRILDAAPYPIRQPSPISSSLAIGKLVPEARVRG